MRVQLICGFLGAGKTTLLKNIIQNSTSDTAVLVNEFGELGIDGTLISEGNNLSITEMPSGCVCCTLRDNLVEAVREILENIKPAQLIIEPSGVASPSSVILGLRSADYYDRIELAPVIGVVDLTFLPQVGDEEDMGEFFKDQLANSDIVLLNKADLVTPEVIEGSRQRVLSMNPSAVVIPTVFCQTEIPEAETKSHVAHFHFSPRFKAEVFTFPGTFDRGKIEPVLNRLASKYYGDIFRAKGILKTCGGPMTFDYVHGLINFGKLAEIDANKLVFIGSDIDRTRLEDDIRGGITDGAGN